MFETPLNQRTVALKVKRIEICDLMLACTAISSSLKEEGRSAKKWDALHDHLKAVLDEFDAKHGF